MTKTTSEVRVAITGELYVGPSGTTLPTDTTSPLDGDFAGLGYFNEDGVTEEYARDTEDIMAWQDATTVRTTVTSATATFKGTLIQTNKTVVETVFGTTVSQSGAHGSYTIDPATTSGLKAWVLEVVDGTNIKRICVAEGEIVEIGEITYATGEPVGYEITLKAYSNPVVYDSSLAS